jgi:hypothetical protein
MRNLHENPGEAVSILGSRDFRCLPRCFPAHPCNSTLIGLNYLQRAQRFYVRESGIKKVSTEVTEVCFAAQKEPFDSGQFLITRGDNQPSSVVEDACRPCLLMPRLSSFRNAGFAKSGDAKVQSSWASAPVPDGHSMPCSCWQGVGTGLHLAQQICAGDPIWPFRGINSYRVLRKQDECKRH